MKNIKKILVKWVLDGLSRWKLLLKKLGLGIGIFSAHLSHLINRCSSGKITNILTNSLVFFSEGNPDAIQKNILKILKDKKNQQRKLLIDMGIFSAYSSLLIKLCGIRRLKKNTLYLDALGTTIHIINRGIGSNHKRLQEINTAICISSLL